MFSHYIGISASYLIQHIFTYRNNTFEVSYADDVKTMRMRFDILENGKKIRVNNDSINNAENTALIAIEKVY